MTEFAVMPEGTKLLPGDRVTLVVTVPEDGSMRVRSRDEDIRVIERPVPEELPTVPGYYVPSENLNETCPRVYGLGISGWWYSSVNGKVQEERMRELMPLIRLVPETEAAPAKLAGRIDVAKLGGRMRSLFYGDRVWAEDAAALIAAIDNGELDK